MNIEAFNPERDRKAVHRIWKEVGWADPSEEKQVEAMNLLFDAGKGWVVRQNGDAECAVFTTTGELKYLDEWLPLAGVSAVTTSYVARKQGYAGRMTAHAVAEEVADGALVSGLGMFEQGYYDRLGFGSGNYANWVRFDPQSLTVEPCRRIPERLTPDNAEGVHRCRFNGARAHGTWRMHKPNQTHEWMLMFPNSFGLGFRDESTGELTHLLVGYTEDAEYGPYTVNFYAYQTREQFLELMGVLKNLGDQVHRIGMIEPPGIQITDLIDQPIRRYLTTLHTKSQMGVRSLAMWQLRINDLAGCLAKTKLLCDEFRFNLKLTDPIERLLPEDAPWRGAGGDYVVTLGTSSGAEPGTDASLPTLTADVPAFSRLWLGLRPATGLSFTANLEAPQELLEQLDIAFRLPAPKRAWPF